MEEEQNENLKKLKRRIKELEEENKNLSERAEDTVILNVVSELLLTKSEADDIISSTFEKITLLKNIPYLCLVNISGETATILREFCNEPEGDIKLKSIFIKKIVLDEIFGGSGILLRPFSEADSEIQLEFSNGFKPAYILLIHSAFFNENEILVILENQPDRKKIKNNIPLFLQVKNFIKWRLENLELLQKIEEQNKRLSKTVEEQTAEINTLLERYRLLIENSQDAIVLHKNRIIQFVNKKALELLGYTRKEELLGKDIFEFIPDEEKERASERIKDALENNATSEFEEFNMLDRNGNVLPAEVSGTTITERDETYLMLTIRDLRPRKAAEKAIKESEEKFRKAFQTNPDSININRLEDGLYISINDGFTRITGWKPEEVIGKTSAEINIWADLNDRKWLVEKLKEQGYCKNLETNFIAKDGRVLRGLMSAAVVELNGVPHIISVTRDITSIKLQEKELKLKNKLLTGTFNSLNYPFYLVDANNFEIILANNAAVEFSKTNSKYCYEFLWGFPERCDPEICSLTQIKKTGKPFVTEINLEAENKQKYFSIHGYPIFDDNNNLMQVIEYVQDITEQKEAEKKLELSELKFRRLFDDAVIGMVVIDKSGRILDANKQICRLSLYSKEELINRKAEDFLTKEEAESELIDYRSIIEGKFKPVRRRLIKKDGTKILVEIHAKKVSENEIQVFILDLSDRQMAEEILKKSEEQYKKIFTMSPVGILLVREAKILFANKAICKLLAAESPDELEGKVVFDFIHPRYKKLAKERMKFLLENPDASVQIMEEQIIDLKGNVKDVLIVGHNIEFEGKPTIQGYMYDITERNRVMRELEEAREKAEAADKLKSEFLAQVSHEIRTPLNVILNYTNLLKDELYPKLEGTYDFVFNGINKNSKRIIRTIDMILNMSEISLGTYSPSIKTFDLHDDVLFAIYYDYKEIATEKGVNLILENKANNSIIKKDHYSVSQIFNHLIDNAVKYTETGEIKITIDRDKRKKLFVEIKDTGIGISREILGRIFTPFEQESRGYTRKYEGAGLGLSIVKSYCNLNNADIKIDSRKDEGTTVRVTFN